MRTFFILPVVSSWESQVINLWPTVIEIVNITETHNGPEPDDFSQKIADLAVNKWNEFAADSSKSPDVLNDEFFKYQLRIFKRNRSNRPGEGVVTSHRNVTWPELENLDEYQRLRRYIESFGKRYLNRLGINNITSLNIFSWAAVHSHSDFHGPHTHTGELLVGVYYAKVNRNSADYGFSIHGDKLFPSVKRMILIVRVVK